MTEKLSYNDLKLGEQAKEAFLEGKPGGYIVKNCPVYLNTKPFFANLNVTDAAIASVIGNLNLFVVGDKGTGKTQLAKDIYNYYFGGNKKDRGQGVFIRGHPEIDIYNEIFTQLNIDKASRELTKNIDSLIFFVDELNRAPSVAQNQFFGLGDGIMDYKGSAITLGRDNYRFLIATANIGGDFLGTFETDKALYNRLHIAIDFDYEMFKPTKEDIVLLDFIREADPNVKEAPKRDISEKIMLASKEVGRMSNNLGLEELAVINYLRFGLETCMKYGSKEKIWPSNCRDCNYNPKAETLCSLVKEPSGQRTIDATKRYASSLYYLAKLKNPETQIDPVDLIFKSFELAGAYQSILSPLVLKQEYLEQIPKMMSGVVAKLKEDFRKNEDFILTSMEQANKGKKVMTFFKEGDNIGNYDALTEKTKKKTAKIEPFTNKREIGLGHVKDIIELRLKLNKNNK